MPDRIEACTFMVAGAITKGDISLEDIVEKHVDPVIEKLKAVGADISVAGSQLKLKMKDGIKATDIKTLPYPGFPTDVQPQFTSLLSVAEGTSVVTETVFENRFMHVQELKRMGADIHIEGQSAIIKGVQKLSGCPVRASDLGRERR